MVRTVDPMGHGHDHAPTGTGIQYRRKLVLVLSLTASVMIIQAVVALLTGSLALLADSGHMLSDSIGLTMALAAITVAQRGAPLGSRRTFGYHRTEILAAGANGLILLGLCTWIVISAIGRLGEPVEIVAMPVLIAGSIGLTVNIIGLAILRSGAKESLNVRGAYLEVLGDALGSIAVIVSSVIILLTGWDRADAVASLAIATLIVPRALGLLRDVVAVLMESSPLDVDLAELRRHILETPGVAEVHDLHVWTITSGMPVMSAHIVVEDSIEEMGQAHEVLDGLRECLAEHFDVEHSTLQLEPRGHSDSEGHVHA